MSRLLGPPSETISNVSERASALAADQIAGAGTMAPAANPETDFRKSRRFMGCSKRYVWAGFGGRISGFRQLGRRARIAYKEVSLPIVRAEILKAFFLGEVAEQRLLSVRVSLFELAQQAVAAHDSRIKCVLGGFFAGNRLLQFVFDHVADQSERSEPNPPRIIGRRFQRDLLDRDRGAGIAVVKTLRASQIEGGAGDRQIAGVLMPRGLNLRL